MGKRFRVAIIGVGAVAQMHAQALAELPQATLVAGSCRTQAKGKAFSERWGCAWYADYESMLATEKPDVACVCTPSGLHLEPVLACARRGVHVLCEKPLEVDVARAERMITACKRGHVTLGGVFPLRFSPVMQAVHEAAVQGRFGHVASINAYVPWWRDDAYYAPERWQGTRELDGGGALINQAIHMVDVLQWMASATMPYLARGVNPVEEVFGFTACRGHDPGVLEVEDTAVAAIRFRSGAVGQLLAATSMFPGTHRRLQIAGRDGMAEVVEDQLAAWRFREERPGDEETRRRFAQQASSHGGGADPMAFSHANHTRNLAAFLDAVEHHRKPALDGVESLKALEIVQAVYQSAETGQPARVR